MKRCVWMVGVLGVAVVPALHAQSADERAVLDVVVRVFDGMRSGDTAMVRSGFHPEARLVTTAVRDDQPVVRIGSIDGFIEAVGNADVVLDEQIYEPEIRIDDNLASVWTFYTFHAGGEFSHCGIDAFQLARTLDGWQITQVSDTRRADDCEPPADGGGGADARAPDGAE